MPVGMILLTLGIYHWHREQLAINGQMEKRERLFREHRLFDIPMTALWAWAAVFLAEDLTYYWFHRLSHERRFWWAAHVNPITAGCKRTATR